MTVRYTQPGYSVRDKINQLACGGISSGGGGGSGDYVLKSGDTMTGALHNTKNLRSTGLDLDSLGQNLGADIYVHNDTAYFIGYDRTELSYKETRFGGHPIILVNNGGAVATIGDGGADFDCILRNQKAIRAEGFDAGNITGGAAAELYQSADNAYVSGYDRDGGSYIPLNLVGNPVRLSHAGTNVLTTATSQVNVTGKLIVTRNSTDAININKSLDNSYTGLQFTVDHKANWLLYTLNNGSGDLALQSRNYETDGGFKASIFNFSHANGSASFYYNVIAYFSDERLKDIKKPISGALDSVNRWRAVHYTANDEAVKFGYKKSTKEIGLLTQDIEKDFPEIVKDAPIANDPNVPENDYKTLQYERVTPVLVAAIQELTAKVEELEKRLDDTM